VVPATVEKLNDDGVSDAPGTSGAVPVPLTVTTCGDPEALSTTDNMAEKFAADAGVKLTEIVQLEPAGKDAPQVLA
jgi:hypothetical protein